MSFEDFIILREGWNDKLLFEQRTLRLMTELIVSGLVGSDKVRMQQWWPLPGDKGGRVVKMVTYKGAQMSEKQMMRLKRLKGEQ